MQTSTDTGGYSLLLGTYGSSSGTSSVDRIYENHNDEDDLVGGNPDGLNDVWYDAWDVDKEGIDDFNDRLSWFIDKVKKEYSHETIPIVLYLRNEDCTTWEHPTGNTDIDVIGGYTELVEWLKE